MKNLTKKYLENQFNQSREKSIREYLIVTNGAQKYIECEYTKGAKVLVDVANHKVYSKNGFFYVVMLNDTNYINTMENDYKQEIIDYADSLFAEDSEETEGEEEEGD